MTVVEHGEYAIARDAQQVTGDGPPGSVIHAALTDSGLFNRAVTVDDELVGHWLKHPEDYPKELKKFTRVILWGSYGQNEEKPNQVAYLQWSGGRVVLQWMMIDYICHGYCPALLRPAA